MEFRGKLIKHGYPSYMVKKWDDAYCKREWYELKGFLKDHRIHI